VHGSVYAEKKVGKDVQTYLEAVTQVDKLGNNNESLRDLLDRQLTADDESQDRQRRKSTIAVVSYDTINLPESSRVTPATSPGNVTARENAILDTQDEEAKSKDKDDTRDRPTSVDDVDWDDVMGTLGVCCS